MESGVMERAELAARSVEVRGSSAIHRVLNFLGGFFLGIESEAQPKRDDGNWWDRDYPRLPAGRGEQAELFDASGVVAYSPAETLTIPAEESVPAPKAKVSGPAIPQTVVSVHSKSRTSARVVATTRVVAPARAAAVKAVPAGRGVVGRQLVMSQSISSGREESRWFSVPQRVLLPRYQLFEGADSVTEDGSGLRIGSPSTRSQSGSVWFV